MELERFYKKLYTTKFQHHFPDFSDLDNLDRPQLAEEDGELLDQNISEQEILALKASKNNKSPGTDGLLADFLRYFGRISNLTYLHHIIIVYRTPRDKVF